MNINLQQTRSVLNLSPSEAREFFLTSESYCDIKLPTYFNFQDVIHEVAQVLGTMPLSGFSELRKLQDIDDVNHRLLAHKSGPYTWRQLDIIHPALYVSLVNEITNPVHWQTILNRFQVFQSLPDIHCMSIPIKSLSKRSDKAEQISKWWHNIEQRTIEYSLQFEYIFYTDIVDCYSSIYTHSIPWAIHGKTNAKRNRNNKNIIGNVIDKHIRDMRYGQTNGIPQGSVLMDFIAEIILGYADLILQRKITAEGIMNYKVLRYRDDYKILVNSSSDGENILKCLTQTMVELGLKLNPEKTGKSNEIITTGIKQDKLQWLFSRQHDRNLQKHLLLIHNHSKKFPGAGSLIGALNDFLKILNQKKTYDSPLPLISIAIDIACNSPRTYPTIAAIIGRLINFLRTDHEKSRVVTRIKDRFSRIPNTGHLEVWLQRISSKFSPNETFDEPLCKLAQKRTSYLWNSSWITSVDLLAALIPFQLDEAT